MRNVTVSLPDEVARWARIQAARNDMSVSKMLAKMIQERMQSEEEYELSAKGFLDEPPIRLKSKSERYPTRDSLHERD